MLSFAVELAAEEYYWLEYAELAGALNCLECLIGASPSE
ncbi:hypothetical protein PBAL39_11982 [Pedobacter sp. BAL39]|nr:hypothetical protein PBAL39_11982 [Pedobacter sp. BAL39]